MFGEVFNALVTTSATRVSLMLDDGILIASEPDRNRRLDECRSLRRGAGGGSWRAGRSARSLGG
jgi:hypothetical protein